MTENTNLMSNSSRFVVLQEIMARMQKRFSSNMYICNTLYAFVHLVPVVAV